VKLSILVLILVASTYGSSHPVRWAGSQMPTPAAGPSLDETLQWIKSSLNSDHTDLTGIRLITSFTHQGCDVTLVKIGGRLTLLRADFNLAAIAYLRVRTEAGGSNTTGTNLIFQTAGERSIRAIRPSLAAAAGLTPTPDAQNLLSWQIGYVRVGAENPYIELGQRLVNAFSHAVALCGGRLRKEPF